EQVARGGHGGHPGRGPRGGAAESEITPDQKREDEQAGTGEADVDQRAAQEIEEAAADAGQGSRLGAEGVGEELAEVEPAEEGDAGEGAEEGEEVSGAEPASVERGERVDQPGVRVEQRGEGCEDRQGGRVF